MLCGGGVGGGHKKEHLLFLLEERKLQAQVFGLPQVYPHPDIYPRWQDLRRNSRDDWIPPTILQHRSLLGFGAAGAADNAGRCEMRLHNVRLNGLHQVTLIGKYVFHQASGGLIDVDIFLRGENSFQYSVFQNNTRAEIYMKQRAVFKYLFLNPVPCILFLFPSLSFIPSKNFTFQSLTKVNIWICFVNIHQHVFDHSSSTLSSLAMKAFGNLSSSTNNKPLPFNRALIKIPLRVSKSKTR